MRIRILNDESGQVLALTLVSMSLLLACIALAVDVGMLFRAKRNAQIAADAAAIAAALATQYPNANVTPTQAADNAAGVNGITDPSQVTVTPSPTNGYHTGAGYVEVKILQPNPTVFMSMFGFSNVTVGARAVAGTVPGPACIYILDPTDASTLYLQGNAHITAPDCGIQVNSSSPDAFCDQGSASITAPYIHIVGGQSGGGKCGKSAGSPVVTGVTPVGDPFKNLTGPTPTNGECTSTSTATSITGNVGGPGNGNSICYTNAVSISSATLGAGTYVFEAGVTLSGTVTVNSGTLDIEQGTFSQGNATLNITAPTSGTYNGIALMQPASNTTAGKCKDGLGEPCLQIQFGSGSGSMTGLIYAPTSQVYQQDHGGSTDASGVIAYQIYLKASDMAITGSYNDSNPGTTPLVKIALVE
jgi:hypothetical protein